MAQKKTPWLLYGLLLGGGYVAYRLYENYAAGTAAPAAAAPPAGTALTVVPVSTSANGGAVDQVAAPITVSTATSSAPTVPTGITSQMYSVVQGWAQSDGRAPVLRFAAANVPAEYAGMYDIITNCWDKNVKPNTTQTAFWNALRSKYDPGDAIW